jgi:hypothetical protein
MPIRGCRIIQNGPDPPTVKLGKSFSLKQDMVIALVQAGWKTGTELVGGDTFSKAALSGALKLTGPGVDRLFKIGPAKSFFDKVAVPMWVTIPKDGLVLQTFVWAKNVGSFTRFGQNLRKNQLFALGGVG